MPMHRPPSRPAARRLSAAVQRFRRATSGSVAAWAAVALPVMSAGAAISVDVSRLQSVDTDLQAAADALSRAGAAELDQSAQSLDRARRAVETLLVNDTRVGADTSITVSEILFLSALPTPRYTSDTASVQTTDPSEARFIEVRVAPKAVSTLFPSKIYGRVPSVTLAARSVAGLEAGGTCDYAPVFICNPLEGDTSTSIQLAAIDPAFQRRQITLVGAGGGAKYAPGNFGWLDKSDGNAGADELRDAIARDVSGMCVSQQAGVHLRPGRIASMRQGFNTRFDIYEGTYASASGEPAYAPAANVTKGWSASASSGGGNGKGQGKGGGGGGSGATDPCAQGPDSAAQGLPRDSSASSALGSNVGNGDWDFTQYMLRNHPGVDRITLEGVTYTYKAHLARFEPTTPPSRYSLYRWEIDERKIPGSATYGSAALSPEEGEPQCHSLGPSTVAEDRRVIKVAVLNCEAIRASGVKFQGRAGPLPVEAMVRVFITEPMGSGKDNILIGEIAGLVDPRAGGGGPPRVTLVQ